MMVTNFEKSFDSQKVLRLLGARPGKTVAGSAMRRIDNLTRDMHSLLDPHLYYRRFALASADAGGIKLANGTRFRSSRLAEALGNAEEICCFVATVGPAIDKEVQRRMKQRRYADAYVLDAIGSLSAENVVEQFFQRTAEKAAKKKRGITLRFSPGYCDWPLDQQRPFFALFADQSPLDVKLNQSCLMSPRKSVSGLFGILPSGTSGVQPAYNPCTVCRRRYCIARRSH